MTEPAPPAPPAPQDPPSLLKSALEENAALRAETARPRRVVASTPTERDASRGEAAQRHADIEYASAEHSAAEKDRSLSRRDVEEILARELASSATGEIAWQAKTRVVDAIVRRLGLVDQS